MTNLMRRRSAWPQDLPLSSVLSIGGLRGETGPAGASGETVTLTATSAISALRIISRAPTGAALTNPALAASLARIIGISVTAAALGTDVQVRQSGFLSDPSWSWTPDLPIFAAASGVLTQTPPTTIALRAVAIAIDATSLQINLFDLFIL